jgi:GNAT superfamily N-acetyltransferase
VRPELEAALKLAHQFKEAAPDTPVIFTVHELKRLARNAAELMTLSAELQAGGIQLELLTGPLTGIYDPNGMGAMFFAVLAVVGQIERNYIREKTLEGQVSAAKKGNHGGRPKVIDDDMLTFALALKDKGVPVPEIAKKLTIKTGKNKDKHPSVASTDLVRVTSPGDVAGGLSPFKILLSANHGSIDPRGRSTPLSTLSLGSSVLELRRATLHDLRALVVLLAADPLGRSRESAIGDEDLLPYERAFDAIDADSAQLLVVATAGTEVVGTIQLSFIPGLSRRGALRAQIEGVRVHKNHRSHGLAAAMFTWAIDEARRRGCALVQLTTDKTRTDAHRFYEHLGFVASHEGLKLQLLAGSPVPLSDRRSDQRR